MSTSQRARSGVPLDHRSILATLPGVPAWGAVAIAAGLAFLGVLIDAARGNELTGAFAFLYVVGCVAAVLLVRYRGLFTAMVQAPLILFVAVPLAYQYFTDNAGTSLKDIILNVAIPLVNRFPLMMLGTVLAVGLGALRIFLKRQNTHAPAVRRSAELGGGHPTRAQRKAREQRPSRSRARRQADSAGRSAATTSHADDVAPGNRAPGNRASDRRPRAATDSPIAPDPRTAERRPSAPIPPTSRYSATDFGRPEAAKPDPVRPEGTGRDYPRPDYARRQYPQDHRAQSAARHSPSERENSAESRYAAEPRRSAQYRGSAEPRRTAESGGAADRRYASEPRRERSSRVQPPREVADPYGTGARPVVPPRPDTNTGGGNSHGSTDHRSTDRRSTDHNSHDHSGDIPPHPVPRVRYRDRSGE